MKRVIFLIVLVIPIFLYSCKKEPVVTKYSIEQFYKNKQVYGGKFSEDETRLLYTSNESGIYNLYEVSIADGTQKQLTNSTQESYFAIDYVPGTNKILYSADKGGNEIDHIYLLNEDGTSTDLTPEEKAKTGFVGWNKEKTAFYFLSTKRDPRFFDLYIMDTKTWKAKLLYQNDKGLSVNEISWDEKYVVLVESITTNDNKLYLVNRLTKEQKEISIPEQPGSYVARGFSLNGKYLYYTTNSQKEFQYLVSYNLETGERNTVFETNWDVINFFLSRYEKYRVIAINEDGKNTLKLFDHKTGQKVESPAIADGDIISIEISDSEKYMRISAGTSKSPADIYFYNMETKELKRLTNSLNPEIDQNQLVAAEVVRYKSFDGLDIPAIFYKPLDATEKNKVPALIWVHGGPGGQSRVGYFALIQYLTNNGYAILAVNNRGSSGYGQTFYKMDDQNHGDKDLMDCVYGKKYLQSLEYIDADKIGIIGGSYGGFMTMAAMTSKPDEFKVGVNLFGVTNWLRTLKSIPPFWASFKNALYAEMGDPTTADSVRLYNISPLFHANNVKNPVMVLQGANDPRVLQVESDEIVEAIKKNGVPVEYVIFPDEGHGFVKKENEIKGYKAILDFLDKYLKEESKTAE
ncbi:MAG TPA: S9 family peptidase [Tenuifilaceae bacterium]|nr:S9 family peptidase [Tenuifilaceae bacterium]HPI44909.1 S9 family peptidase [Tenuifilaceae bacterium]HPN22210.1 S9 family peptidase [Tenuifilaceae bacterium]